MMMEIECKIERYEAAVSVKEYMEKCVDVPTFLEYCKKCDNYGKIWSCPSYDFEPEDYWKKYQTLHIVGMKILLPDALTEKRYEGKERDNIMQKVLFSRKKELDQQLLSMEEKYPGSVSLSGGSCLHCEKCTRPEGSPCRFPGRMRYSIESLGGNVGLTVTKYLHQRLLWMEEGKLPQYFILVGGLLLP